jgi:peptide/nickel transport system ATP-binding protein
MLEEAGLAAASQAALLSTHPLLRVERLRLNPTSPPTPSGAHRLPPLEAISFSIAEGEQVALVGPPKSGKTALLRTIALLEKPAAGRIYFKEQEITHAWGGRLRAVRQNLQFVGGDPMRTLPLHYTVEQTLIEPLRIHRRGSADAQRTRVAATAELLNLNHLLLGRKVSALSAMLRQRVALARAFTLQPRLLIADELTERLEPAAARPLLETVAHACRTHPGRMAWLWSTSNRTLAHDFADRVLFLENGRLIA